MRLHVNGIDMATGQYLLPPAELVEPEALAAGAQPEGGVVGWLSGVARSMKCPHLGLPAGTDPSDPSQAGWGIVFSTREPAETSTALQPLVEHRRKRLGDDKVKVLDHRPGEEWRDWLTRHDVRLGTVEPSLVPYYLLLVGGPQDIPFDFQYMIDVEYAVGRLSLASASEYASYAATVCEYETAVHPPGVRKAVFFGTEHDGDLATATSRWQLVGPLAGEGTPNGGIARRLGFASEPILGSAAKKDRLTSVLADPGGSPAFLLSATHGLGFEQPDDRQAALQGALICQDWDPFEPVSEADCFKAEDVTDTTSVNGLVAFCFACFSAGTPERDEYPTRLDGGPRELARAPFVARLPQALLSHPRGGALAVMGHVERAWGYSIASDEVGPQRRPFENLLHRVLAGLPVGFAMRDFRERHAALTAELAYMLGQMRQFGRTYKDEELLANWVERNDARNYAVIGDPAVRLRIDAISARLVS